MTAKAILGFIYELRRTLLSAPLILIMVLIVGLSFGVLATLAQSTQTSYVVLNSAEYYYTTDQGHVVLYSYDNYNRPVSGVFYNLTFYPLSGNLSMVPIAYAQGTSGSNGLVDLSVSIADQGGYSVLIDYSDVSSAGSVSARMPATPFGVVKPLYWSFAGAVASGTGFSATTVLQVFYLGPYGTAPSDYQVYWAGPITVSETPPAPLPEQSMTYLGSLNSYHQTYPLVVPGAVSTSGTESSPQRLQIEIFTSSGQLVAQDANQSASAFAPAQTSLHATTVAFSFVSGIIAFFVPIMAILAAYSTYGKDRVSGVLDGALCRPVSRIGLALSRYLAVIVALGIAVLLGVCVMDGLIVWAVGSWLPQDVVFALFGSLVIEIGAFVGLTFLLAYVVRSSGTLIGGAVGVWALFGVAWNTVIVNLAVTTGNPVSSPQYVSFVVGAEFLNPADFVGLVQSLVTGVVVGGLGGSLPQAYGITYPDLVAAGLAWLLVPLALFLYLVQTRD